MTNPRGKILAVILPAYNEYENIQPLLERWSRQEAPLKDRGIRLVVLVVDDGSKDETSSLLMRLENEYSFLLHTKHATNLGLGQALSTGIHHVMDQEPHCTYITVMDCDNTQDPVYIIPLIEKMDQEDSKDVVIASRYQPGSNVTGVPFYRLFLSYGARVAYTLFLRVPKVRDYTCGYRLYNVSHLQKAVTHFGESLLEEKGFGCMVELLYKLHLLGGRFAEIPFHLRYEDKLGHSKMKVMNTMVRSLSLVFRLRSMGKGISNL